jgi:hypothetical protein
MNSKPALPTWTVGNGRNIAVGAILVTALVGFEIFNFDTTKFALSNLFGDLKFLGIAWAGILAFAFCGIDFAGMVRMFTPEQGRNEPKEVWLLLGAWFIGATMNAVMTWYAVALAIANRPVGVGAVSQADVQFYAPIFVAGLVWLTRILFIGSLSVAAEHINLRPDRSRSRPSQTPVRYRQSSNHTPVESHQDDLLQF